MKIDIKPLVRAIALRQYAEEYGDQVVWIWVNPPRQLRLEHWDIVQDFQAVTDSRAEFLKPLEGAVKAAEEAEAAGEQAPELPELDADVLASLDQQINDLSRRLYGWFAELWSKHNDDETHWTADDVLVLVEACLDADPRLWDWLQDEQWRLLREHREGVKKK